MPLNQLLVHNFELEPGELGKIEAFIPNLQPNAPVPESMGKSTLKNAPQEPQCCASSHEQSGLDKSPELVWKILKNTQNGFFKGIFSSVLTDGAQMKLMKQNFPAAEVLAVEELQCLPKIPVPIQHMAIFYDSVAELDRDVLKLPIQGYVQANSASRRQWRKRIGAAELEWAKAHGGILYNKWYLLEYQDTYTWKLGELKKASVNTWTTSKLSSKWHSVDFLRHHLCGPSSLR